MYAIDQHDHTPGRGKRITTEAIQDLAVTSPKLADKGVIRAKIGDAAVGPNQLDVDAVITQAIKNYNVTSIKLAPGAVGFGQLDPNVRPIGEIMAWWRPTPTSPVPTGWEIADGRSITAHDFPGGGSITLPDLRNRFLLGAALGGTGTGPTLPPDIGQTGGSNAANLSHTHTVAHDHVVPGHAHTVQPHAHTLKPHTHNVPAHTHTVSDHTHTVGGHTHPVAAHNHGMVHDHNVENHAHSIAPGGIHSHSFDSPIIVGLRNIVDNPNGVPLHSLVAGLLSQGDYLHIQPDGSHDHQGATGFRAPKTDASRATTDNASTTANPNSPFSTGGATPTTSAQALTTSAQNTTVGEGTENTTVDTYNSTAFNTATSTPTTSPALASTDIRPAHAGVLFLVKVKNS